MVFNRGSRLMLVNNHTAEIRRGVISGKPQCCASVRNFELESSAWALEPRNRRDSGRARIQLLLNVRSLQPIGLLLI